MKYATYRYEGQVQVGLMSTDELSVTPVTIKGHPVSDLHDLLGDSAEPTGSPITLDRVELLAPIPRPRRNIFCVGKNYAAHAKEFAGSGFDAGHTGAPEELPVIPSCLPRRPSA